MPVKLSLLQAKFHRKVAKIDYEGWKLCRSLNSLPLMAEVFEIFQGNMTHSYIPQACRRPPSFTQIATKLYVWQAILFCTFASTARVLMLQGPLPMLLNFHAPGFKTLPAIGKVPEKCCENRLCRL